MNLDFGILWIEDSYNLDEETNLKRRVTDAGFSSHIDSIPNSQNLRSKAKENNLFHRYDLVLLDYKLKDENGGELAPTVRNLFPSTTILFYSGSLPEKELRGLIAAREVEGVYCCSRDRFIERAGNLIEQTANSLNRLSGMRGLAMQVVAECDDLLRLGSEMMTHCDDSCKDLLEKLDQDVMEFITDNKNKYQDAMKKSFEERLKTRAVDSNKLYKHFRRLTRELAKNGKSLGLGDTEIDRLRELGRDTSKYDQQVLKKRNILGHVRESEGQNGWTLEGGDISISDFPSLRRTFAEHIIAFREINQIIEKLHVELTK